MSFTSEKDVSDNWDCFEDDHSDLSQGQMDAMMGDEDDWMADFDDPESAGEVVNMSWPEEDQSQGPVRRVTMAPPVCVDDLDEDDFDDRFEDCDKTDEMADWLAKQIKVVVLFVGYDDDDLQIFVDKMFLRSVKAGDVVIRQGEKGDAFYVIKSGNFRCELKNDDGTVKFLKNYEGSGYFGELALLNNSPRAATISAETDGSLFVLNSSRYHWLKSKHEQRNVDLMIDAIKSIPMFRDSLDGGRVSQLINCVEMVIFHPGDVICHQGDEGDAMYFVMDGNVEVVINSEVKKTLGPGWFFGERALILAEKRAATCQVTTRTKLAKLSKDHFDVIMPEDLIEKMKNYIMTAYGPVKQTATKIFSSAFDINESTTAGVELFLE